MCLWCSGVIGGNLLIAQETGPSRIRHPTETGASQDKHNTKQHHIPTSHACRYGFTTQTSCLDTAGEHWYFPAAIRLSIPSLET
ncbi:hypothetical protein VTJ04DRAFT_9777 [Mycothermus thermophilus]|uniref:uncharacterized protein n=1 Tax=Humicola insolens TaxID=85995 RepID=UPI003742D6BC